MLGDLRKAVRRWVLQNIACTHHYVTRSTPAGAFHYEQCVVCDRTRDWTRV